MSLIKPNINKFMSEKKDLNKSIPDSNDLVNEIILLKQKKKAVILAHYYQNSEIQELADYLGDSLYLAQCAKKVTSDIIVLAGVHFMGETAKIINPKKKVLVPDLKAGCSLSDSCPPDEFKKYIGNHPDHNVVTYINCSAQIKALSTIVCTSSNAKKVINSIPENEKIIFAPDKNLGKYLIKETGRDMKLWNGSCIVHEAFSLEKIINLIKKYPQAKFIAHPESESPVLEIANFIGSTSELLNFVQKDLSDTYIVATENGILHEMKKKCPNKEFIPAPVDDDTCACSECSFMKMNTLEKLYLCLLNESPEIILPNEIIDKSIIPIEKMLALG
tara:strand:- start:14 stop:1009 length:996 start_codon:yes stop_codon:yes gene_type:complete